MFLSDPALRAIAAATDDALPGRVWRHETAGHDVYADLARLLHTAATAFNDHALLLHRALHRVHETSRRLLDAYDTHAAVVHPHGLDTDALHLVQQIERASAGEATLIACYQMWRKNQPAPADTADRHLLVVERNPAHGVVTMRPDGTDRWLISADSVAADRYQMRMPDRLIGQVTHTDRGFEPLAYTDPDHITAAPHLVYDLPYAYDARQACRMILRWWQFRYSPAWQSRTLDQLTPTELAALAI